MRHSPLSVRECAVVVLGMLVASVAATWPIAAHAGSALPGDLGDPLLNTWIMAWDAARLRHGLSGLWDAPIFFPAGRTLTWSEHLLGIAIPLAPLEWISGNAVLVYNVAFIGSYLLAGFGGYVLSRELGLGGPAAMVGAAATAFAPYRADEMTHLQVLMTGWAPLALAALHRFGRTGSLRAAACFAIAFALLALSNTYFLFYFALPVALVWLFAMARARAPRRTLAAGTILAAALLIATVGPVLFAYWRTRQSTGLIRAWDEITDLSARAIDYLSVGAGSWLWRETFPVAPAEHALFPGVMILVLAAAGVAYGLQRRDELDARQELWPYIATLAIAIWGSFGPRGGLYTLGLYAVPGLEALRMVTRLFSVATVALAVLAAFGTEWVLGSRSRRAGLLGGSMLAAIIFVEGLAAPMAAAPFDSRLPAEVRPMYTWLRQQPDGAVLELPIAGPALGAHTLLYQFATLSHGHPIMNGYSGSGSALQDFLASRHSPIYEPGRLPDLLSALRAMGVRYVIAHPNWLASQTRAEWLKQAMTACADQVETVFYGGDAIAWSLRPAQMPEHGGRAVTTLERVPAESYSLTASAEGASRLSDGDVSSTWVTPSAQDGSEWIRVNFASPLDVRRVTFALGWRRVAEYPRALTIESIDPAGVTHALIGGSPLSSLLPALLAPGPAVPLSIELPPNRSSAIVLRQTQAAPAAWSVNELHIWSAAR